MALTVKKLSDRLVPLTVDIDGEKLHIVYRPSAVTPAYEGELGKVSQSQQWPPLTAKLIASWDLKEEDGKTDVPLTLERLRELPISFLSRVCMAAAEDMRPNRQTAGRSDDGSLAAGS